MPVSRKTLTTGGKSIERPFVGPINHTVAIPVPIAGLTAAEVDVNGFLKAGTPLLRSGALVTAGAVFGCVAENTKVAEDNATATLAAAGTPEVAVATIGQVNRDILEDSLGRVLTAAEIAGFGLAGSMLKLLD